MTPFFFQWDFSFDHHSRIQISGKTLSFWMSVSEFKHDASQGIMELSLLQGKGSQN